MFSRVIIKVLAASVLISTLHLATSYAGEEAKKEEPKKEGEGATEGGGEGEVSESQKKQMNEATELQAKVQALQAKIKSKEENINKLIEEKNQTKDSEKVKDIIAEMVADHKEMSKMIEEYEQNRSLLRYRYPEKGYKGGRTYERMEVKPLDQMENQMSVESKLKRNLKTVHAQYGQVPEDKNAKKKKEAAKEIQAPSLTEPIVIQK